jgi:hypothetical protein
MLLFLFHEVKQGNNQGKKERIESEEVVRQKVVVLLRIGMMRQLFKQYGEWIGCRTLRGGFDGLGCM